MKFILYVRCSHNPDVSYADRSKDPEHSNNSSEVTEVHVFFFNGSLLPCTKSRENAHLAFHGLFIYWQRSRTDTCTLCITKA